MTPDPRRTALMNFLPSTGSVPALGASESIAARLLKGRAINMRERHAVWRGTRTSTDPKCKGPCGSVARSTRSCYCGLVIIAREHAITIVDVNGSA